MKHIIVIHAVVGALFLSACLPGDTRPTPGRVFMTAEPSTATTEGFSTADGWKIQFDRLLVGLGNVTLRGEDCNDYGEARYDRLFEFKIPGATKLGELYGLGPCDLQVRIRSPSEDALLQKGVTTSDLAFMREPLVNVPLPQMGPVFFGDLGLGTAVYARGTATRGNETKRFDWRFGGSFRLTNCANDPAATPVSSIQLKGGDDLRPTLTLHGEELFRETMKAGAPLRFDLLASADADADGNITLKELESIPSPPVEPDPDAEEGDLPEGGLPEVPTLAGLAGYLNEQLLPRMVYLDQNRCKPRLGGGR